MKRRILVAYDDSDLSKEALQEAKLQATGVPETEVHVILVVTQAGPTTNIVIARNIEMEIAESLRPKMQATKEEFEAEEITVHTKVMVDYRQIKGIKVHVIVEKFGNIFKVILQKNKMLFIPFYNRQYPASTVQHY